MKRRAFTLMEMLVALAIIGVIVSGSFIATSALNEERTLRAPLNELRIMAKKAWARSMEEQRAWQIRLLKGKFVLEPRQAIQEEDRKIFKQTDEAMGRSSGIDSYEIDQQVRMEVRHWGEDQWHDPRPDSWVFEHSGLCEPINIRFISSFATVTVSFDPLTGSVAEETFEHAGER